MKKMILITIIIACFGFIGCTKTVNTTESENAMIAEYTAALLLKYDKNYENKLNYNAKDLLTEVEENEDAIKTNGESIKTPNKTNATTIEISTVDSPDAKYNDLATVFNQNGFEISLLRYSKKDSYPDDASKSYFNLEVGKGKQLLILEFEIKNTTDSSKSINVITSGITYDLKLNSTTSLKPLMTLLINDLQYLEMNIKPNSSKIAVLAFEIPKDIELDDAKLFVTKENKTAMLKIK